MMTLKSAVRRIRNWQEFENRSRSNGTEFRNTLEGYLKGKSARHLISEPYITRRNERYVIPVRVEAQTSIPGVVHASSGSGATVFLEPLAAVNLNNRLLQSENQEIRKIQQLMVRLSEAARNHFEELLSLVDRLAQLDACQAAAEFARRHRCCLPVVSESGELYLENARHPLLEVAQSGAVPITIRLFREQQILVISGPNAGGKTVALKTIGLFCCMAQAGLPISCRSSSASLLSTDPGRYRRSSVHWKESEHVFCPFAARS